MKILQANRIAPDGMPRSAASHLGLCCLPMSHKRDARLKWVKIHMFGNVCDNLIFVNIHELNALPIQTSR